MVKLDVGSGNGANDPVWHYHSNYDTYHWMSTFGDPGFHQHAAIGQYLALLVYHLASDDILPLDVSNYGTELAAYRDDLVEFIEPYGVDLDLSELNDAIETFSSAAAAIKSFEEGARALNDEGLIAVLNHKYAQFQRGFVSQGGLPDREFYRHAITAPGLDTGMFLANSLD